jgi:CRP/FNR family transcriptional regulator, cyclic AMP receptor protein
MKTILIVEDDKFIREDVEEMLTLAGYSVVIAQDGKEGIAKAKELNPDLIITDIAMPFVDGMGLLYMLRHDTKTEGTPVIFLTSKSERNDIRNAMASGADDYITKPFNNEELLKAIENRFSRLDILKKKLASELQTTAGRITSADSGDLEKLIVDCETHSYQKKQLIYKEGCNPHYLFYILKGRVRTYKDHEDGKQLSTDIYSAGDFIGYNALLEESTYMETAEAIDEVELALVPRKNFENLVHGNLCIANKLIRMLAKNITEKENYLIEIAYDTLRKKVAKTLVNVQKKFQSDKAKPFYNDISRDDLASMAGTAKESFIRTLAEFKKEMLIDVQKDNKIEIINFPKLEYLIR